MPTITLYLKIKSHPLSMTIPSGMHMIYPNGSGMGFYASILFL